MEGKSPGFTNFQLNHASFRPFFQQLLPHSEQLHLKQCELDTEQQQMTLSVLSTQYFAKCPVCGTPSARIHSHYERTLADLPCVNFNLTYRDAEEVDLLTRLVAAHPDLNNAIELAEEFSQLLRKRGAEGFEP